MFISEGDKMNELSVFFDKNIIDKEELIDVIKYTKTRLQTLDLQKKYNKKFYYMSKIIRNNQKEKNLLFLNEIRKIAYFSNCEGMRIVFLKGIFLAEILYDNPADRLSNDIDVLVYINDFEKIDLFLKSNGYKYANRELEKENLLFCQSILKTDHICYEKKKGNHLIRIEVHGNVINAGGVFCDITDDFLKHSIKKSIDGLSVFLLQQEYNVVFLMMHFYKHLPYAYFDNLLWGNKPWINVSNLQDIYYLVTKERIEWNNVLAIVKKMKIVKYVLFVANIINNIFGNVINDIVIEELSSNIKLSNMIYDQSFKYGMGNFLWLFDELLFDISKQDVVEMIRGVFPKTLDLRMIAVNDKCQITDIKRGHNFSADYNVFLDTIDGKITDNETENVEIKLVTEVDKTFISIMVTVKNKECCFWQGIGNLWEKDGVELLIVKKDKLIHRMFTLAMINEQLSIIESSHKNEHMQRLVSDEQCAYKFEQQEKNCYSFCIALPWEYLEINTDDDKFIPFNVGVLLSNPNTNTQQGCYKLFENKSSFFEFKDIQAINV